MPVKFESKTIRGERGVPAGEQGAPVGQASALRSGPRSGQRSGPEFLVLEWSPLQEGDPPRNLVFKISLDKDGNIGPGSFKSTKHVPDVLKMFGGLPTADIDRYTIDFRIHCMVQSSWPSFAAGHSPVLRHTPGKGPMDPESEATAVKDIGKLVAEACKMLLSGETVQIQSISKDLHLLPDPLRLRVEEATVECLST